jgi:ABC-type transport system involved in multi-copper enzyme maturation permease subunit
MGAARILSVFRFEWSRALTVPRMAWWVLLAVFPPGIFAVIRFMAGDPPDPILWTILLFVLIPGVVCLMGLLLWATPLLQTELEGKTWTYLAVRPGGKTAMLLGKHLTAVSWTALAGWVALGLSLIVTEPPEPVRNALVLGTLVLLACLAYGAVFAFIGVILPKRAMVVAVVYTMVVEFLIGFIPAVVNELTVQFRLRALLVKWMGWEQTLLRSPELGEMRTFLELALGSAPAWQHVVVLLAGSAALLTVSAVVLRLRELVASDEDS